jgi:hypothetical protein
MFVFFCPVRLEALRESGPPSKQSYQISVIIIIIIIIIQKFNSELERSKGSNGES